MKKVESILRHLNIHKCLDVVNRIILLTKATILPFLSSLFKTLRPAIMKRKVPFAILLLLTFGCLNEENNVQLKAEVVAFHAEKCMCCWGWDIKIGDKLIRTDSGIVGIIVGHEIKESVPVIIVLGEKEEDCSSRTTNMDFYDITDIKLIE